MSRVRRSMRSRPANTIRRCHWRFASRAFFRCRSRRYSMMAKSEEGQEDRPVTLRSAALMALLGLLALAALSGVAGIVRGLIATDTLWGPWTLKTGTLLVANLLVCIAAIVILLKFKSQRVTGEPVSPATRRARMLFGLSGLIAAAAMVVM